MLKRILIILLLTTFLINFKTNVSAKVLFEHDFEMQEANWVTQLTHSDTTFSWIWGYPNLSTEQSRNGNKSVKFEHSIGSTDTCTQAAWRCEEIYMRTMLMLLPHPNPNDKEFWYGFSIYVPEDWINDNPNSSMLFWQTKSEADNLTNPQLAIFVTGDKIELLKQIDGNHAINMGPLTKGEWIDFALHVKYSTGSDGFIKAYRNGDYMGNIVGKTQNLNQPLLQMSYGVYKWAWRTPQERQASRSRGITERIIYFDSIKLGDSNSSLSEVNPGNNNPQPTPTTAVTPTPQNTPTPQLTPSISPKFDPKFDLDNNGVVNILDVVEVIKYIFQ